MPVSVLDRYKLASMAAEVASQQHGDDPAMIAKRSVDIAREIWREVWSDDVDDVESVDIVQDDVPTQPVPTRRSRKS